MNSFVSPLLYIVSRYGNDSFYTLSYYVSGAIDAALQIAVTIEFAHHSLRQRNRWIPGARMNLAAAAIVAVAISAVLSFNSQPSAEDSSGVFFVRISLFVTVLVLMLAMTILFLSFENGRLWKKPVISLFGGFLVWSIFSGVTDTLHILKSTSKEFELLESSRFAVTVLVTAFWLVAVLLPETTGRSPQSDDCLRGVRIALTGE